MEKTMHVALMPVALAVFWIGVFSMPSAGAVDLYETYKDTAFSSGWTSLASGEYTLSGDLCVTNAAGAFQEMRFGSGVKNLLFDFSDGNHTLKAQYFRVYGSSGAASFRFKGGRYETTNGGFVFGGWSNLPYGGYTWTMEDLTLDCTVGAYSMVYGYGKDITIAITNSMLNLRAGNYLNFRQAVADTSYGETGTLIEFAKGTKVYCPYSWYDNRDHSTKIYQNTIIRFTGEGTVGTASAAGAGTTDIYFGQKAPGYRWEILDHARLSFRYLNMGTHENGFSNEVYIAGGGLLEAKSAREFSIGGVAGAGANRVTVGEGGCFTNLGAVVIGAKSSDNVFTVSNGTAYAKEFQLGSSDASLTGNILHVQGRNASLSMAPSSYTWVPFKNSTGNSIVFEDHAALDISDCDLCMSNGSVPSTNNYVRLDTGASLSVRYFKVTNVEGSYGNEIFIGDNATLTATKEYLMSGTTSPGNTTVISNGTVNFKGGYGFFIAGANNVCKIFGKSPKVRFTGADTSDGVITFRNSSGLEIDLSELDESGYDEPIFSAKQFQMHENIAFSFTGVETLTRKLRQPVVLPIAHGTQANMSTAVNANTLAAAQAALPDNAKLYISNDNCDLYLKVNPITGTLIYFK